MEIFLPQELMFVGEDETARVRGGYKYNIEAIFFKDGMPIEIKKNKINNTPEKLLATLFKTYKDGDRSSLEQLFDEVGKKLFKKISPEKYNAQMNFLSKISKPRIHFVLKHNKGLTISWYDPAFLNARKIFIQKIGDEYKIANYHAEKDDHFFANVNLYFNTYPFEIHAPKIEKSFRDIKNGEVKELSFKLKKEFHYVYIFKKENGKNLIKLTLQDNYQAPEYPLNDLSDEKKYVEVKLKGENFKEFGIHDLYYLESSYPMAQIPESSLKLAQKITISKTK